MLKSVERILLTSVGTQDQALNKQLMQINRKKCQETSLGSSLKKASYRQLYRERNLGQTVTTVSKPSAQDLAEVKQGKPSFL